MSRKSALLHVILVLSALSILAVAQVEVKVKVRGEIGGVVEYLNYTRNATNLFSAVISWYNSASVNCRARARADIIDASSNETVATVWSEEKIANAGASSTLKLFWLAPREGDYKARIRIYHCQEIFEVGELEFHVKALSMNQTIKLELKEEGEKIKARIRWKGGRKAFLVPISYPMGWVFPCAEVKMSGEEEEIEIRYEPSVFQRESVTYIAVSEDGKQSSTPVMLLLERKRGFLETYGMYLVLTALLISLTFNVKHAVKLARKKRKIKRPAFKSKRRRKRS